LDYPWLKPELGCLYGNFLPEDIIPLLKASDVMKTVVVQAISSYHETDWLLSQAEKYDFIAGVVCWIDLLDDKIEYRLEKLVQNKTFIAVRHQIEDEPDKQWILQAKVLYSLMKLAEYDICFDALMKPDQLKQLEEVLGHCPCLKIIIDHEAKPDIKNKKFESWAKQVESAAKLPVFCKLSGLFTEADHKHWTQTDIAPYTDFLLEKFSAGRLIFGSDWPVSTMASSYARTLESSRALCGKLPSRDIEGIFSQNAICFYNLEIQ
jgi:L-fuconolactonase